MFNHDTTLKYKYPNGCAILFLQHLKKNKKSSDTRALNTMAAMRMKTST